MIRNVHVLWTLCVDGLTNNVNMMSKLYLDSAVKKENN